jgi:hypothetical protein
MRCVLGYGYGLSQMITAVVVGCLIAGAVSMMTRPSVADSAVATSTSVNRALKGDRLLPAKAPRGKRDAAPRSSKRIGPTSTGRPPIGCDPAFSTIGAPSHTLPAARCLT